VPARCSYALRFRLEWFLQLVGIGVLTGQIWYQLDFLIAVYLRSTLGIPLSFLRAEGAILAPQTSSEALA